jgi:hypothetical protein
MTSGFLWWLTRKSKNALPDFMLARFNYAKLSSNYQEFNQSYALLAANLSKGNVGKALMQKREQGTAPEWHGKICRMRSSRERPTD